MEDLKNSAFSLIILKRALIIMFSEAPPLSAFSDYNIDIMNKKRMNSVKEFYRILFSKKQPDDSELHSAETE